MSILPFHINQPHMHKQKRRSKSIGCCCCSLLSREEMVISKLLTIVCHPNLFCLTTKTCTHLYEVHFAKASSVGMFSRTTCSSMRLKVSALNTSSKTSELANVNWDNLGFDLMPTDYMYKMKCYEGEVFSDGELLPFGNLEMNPSAAVLNQGQGVVGGMKAYRREDGYLVIFRPEKNGLRMRVGAERLCMPAPTVDQFVEAVKITVSANRGWVPPPNKGFLYIRPLLIATGSALGINAVVTEYTFFVYTTPVRYSFEGDAQHINLVIDNEYHRAVPSGAGNIYAIGNYASTMRAQEVAKANGFYDILYLDLDHSRYVEGASTANIFMVKDNLICTPAPGGTIVAGVTRESIIDIARDLGFQVEERLVSVEELLSADEVFCTGNATGVLSVGSITYLDKRVSFKGGGFDSVSRLLKCELMNLQMGVAEDKMGWTVVI